ncbi:DOF zinc finger protein DOF4.6-like protein isoform X1 [Tanacetum coccineum]
MDAAQWSEGLGAVKSMEEKKTIRPQKPQAINCPRRYWTNGGSLRNVPVGGGSRRNKRSSSSVSSSSSSAANISQNQHQMMMGPPPPSLITQNPSKTIIQGQGQSQAQGQDLNLGYTNPATSLQFGNLPYNLNNTTLLKSGFGDPRQVMMSSLPNTMIMNSHAGLNFSLDGLQNNGAYDHHLQGGASGGVTNHQSTMSTITTTDGTNGSARILFPFQDLKAISTANSELDAARVQGESSTGYWSNGGLGGGSW